MKTHIAGFTALALALLLVGGAAVASIPAPDGTINGCRQDSTGNLRVIDSEETCPSGWSPLNWPSQDRYAYWADGYNVVMSQAIVPANTTITVAATCPPSQTAIHGGWSIGTDQDVRIRRWGPSGGSPPAGWFGRFTNHEDIPTTGAVSVFASCVDLNPFP
jgi:hypothetical protein